MSGQRRAATLLRCWGCVLGLPCVAFVMLAVASLHASTPSAVAADPSVEAFFEKEVRPLLVSRCSECHAGEKAGGGLSLETREGWTAGGESGPAIVVGDPGGSLLVDLVAQGQMPPEGSEKLTAVPAAAPTQPPQA